MPPKKNLLECYEDGNLDLSLSGIQEIPVRDIAAIPKAINLDLSSNIITTVPKSFATSLTRLVKLDLSQNQITSLPDNFGLLVNLKHLDLDNNKLESLPLSFGNLKNLRWLDLKRNPLMPKLAQIAGLCQDAKQCQAAARNVVAALRAMQETVDAEMARRKEEKDKLREKMEENLKAQAKENQPSKKKKKKNANAAGNKTNNGQANGKNHSSIEEEDGQKINGDTLPSVPTKETNQKDGFFRKVANMLRTIVKVTVITTMCVVFVGFLLSLFNEDLYASLQKMVSDVIKAKVPKHYIKHWNNGVLVTRKAITNWSSQLIALSVYCFNKSQEYYGTLSTNERVQHYLEGFQKGWHILWIWLNETYAYLSVEIPQSFNSVKKILFESSTTKS